MCLKARYYWIQKTIRSTFCEYASLLMETHVPLLHVSWDKHG